MKVENKINFFSIISKPGNVEILKFLKQTNKTTQFKELKLLFNPKKEGKFSSATISKSLKELEKLGFIKSEIIKNKSRKTQGYILTNSGNETASIVKEAEEKYQKIEK